jgi:hypothetical protein
MSHVRLSATLGDMVPVTLPIATVIARQAVRRRVALRTTRAR